MSASESFLQTVARLNAGDRAAATEVFSRYAARLVALARSRLPQALRSKEDPEDVVQSAFNSFFRRQRDGEYELINWDSLWGLLALITIRKCGHRIEFYGADRRDADRERHPFAVSEDSISDWQALARDPTPSQAAMLAETLEHLLAELDDRDRQIVSLALEGHTPQEIAGRINRSERTVQRTLRTIATRLGRDV